MSSRSSIRPPRKNHNGFLTDYYITNMRPPDDRDLQEAMCKCSRIIDVQQGRLLRLITCHRALIPTALQCHYIDRGKEYRL